MEFKLKKRHVLVAIAACLLIFMVKMCESDDFATVYQKDREDIEKLGELQYESDSLLTEVLHNIDTKQHQYGDELDSLNNIILNDNLTVEQVDRLKKKIRDTEKLLRDAQNAEDTVIISAGITISETVRDSIIWNIVEMDSVRYNITEVDSVIYHFVVDTVYKIDTIHYRSDEIKKLKLKNN